MTASVSSVRHFHRPFQVELVGPAGAGKSTLCGTLTERLAAPTGMIWGLPVLPLLGNGLQLVPAFGPMWFQSGSLLWSETRHMVRLRTLERAIERSKPGGPNVLIFDEGPVFAMAWLRGFGHETMRAQSTEDWWRATLQVWASLIDVVVVLDAPDLILAQRIRARARAHEVKTYPDDEIARWMGRFRAALEWVLAELGRHGGPRVVRLSSEDKAAECIADTLVEELAASVHAR